MTSARHARSQAAALCAASGVGAAAVASTETAMTTMVRMTVISQSTREYCTPCARHPPSLPSRSGARAGQISNARAHELHVVAERIVGCESHILIVATLPRLAEFEQLILPTLVPDP